jgi:hypothetical protein
LIRWLRVIATWTLVLAMIALGVVFGLFLMANNGWITVNVPPWLHDWFGDKPREVWLPVLIAGWLLTALLMAALIGGSFFYVWRRRQYEVLTKQLERELTRLRNLPFEQPAPMEDEPEVPSALAAQTMAQLQQLVADAESNDIDREMD